MENYFIVLEKGKENAPEVYRLDVISKTAKQVKVHRTVASDWCSIVTNAQLAAYDSTPEAAIARWRREVEERIERTRAQLDRLEGFRQVTPAVGVR